MMVRICLPALVTAVLVTASAGCGEDACAGDDCGHQAADGEGGTNSLAPSCALASERPASSDGGVDADAEAGPSDGGADADSGPILTTCVPACELTQTCNMATFVCQASNIATTPAQASAQIAAFIAAPAGVQNMPLPVSGAFVTFLKPEVAGSTEASGFFLQAQANGPAMFVLGSASPTQVAVGDRVTFSVTEKDVVDGRHVAKVVADLTVVSSKHRVENLDTTVPAGLKVDASGVTSFEDVATTTTFESRLVTLTGKLKVGAPSGAAFTAFPIGTAREPTTSNLRLRVPTTVASSLDLASGCDVTIPTGIVWRSSGEAQVSVFAPEQLTGIVCPAPRLLEAVPVSTTELRLTFDRTLSAASVQAADFGITPAVTVLTATAAGKEIVLTTAPLTVDTDYTVSVDGDVTDNAGKAVDPAARSASFRVEAKLVINEIDYDTVGSADNAEFVEIYNAGSAPADLSDVIMVLVNGDSIAMPRREYLRFALSGTTDAAGTATTTLPAGGYLVAASQPFFDTVPLPAGALRLVIKSASNTNTDIIQNGAGDGVGLIRFATGTLLDSVYYEPGAHNSTFAISTGVGDIALNFVENTRSSAADSNTVKGSLQRTPNGKDTDNNDADFAFVNPPTRGAPTP